MRMMIEQQEMFEARMTQDNLQVSLQKQFEKIKQKQHQALGTLLKRIQRDREEQVKHRQLDSERLIQRNKNLLQDVLVKQATEQRRTKEFLKFALGRRETKSDEELKREMSQRKYNP